ncbi:MAG: hypothetical protein WC554_16355 [Clostridia bacterium]|jgi:co-chaperonin GroES (HSP10)
MKLIPVGERLLVKLDAVDEKKVGSILVPAKHGELSRAATVLAAGDEVKRFKVGDRIFLGYHSGNVVDIAWEKADTLRIVDEAEIWGFVTEE